MFALLFEYCGGRLFVVAEHLKSLEEADVFRSRVGHWLVVFDGLSLGQVPSVPPVAWLNLQ